MVSHGDDRSQKQPSEQIWGEWFEPLLFDLDADLGQPAVDQVRLLRSDWGSSLKRQSKRPGIGCEFGEMNLADFVRT
jgi:hypothetical protein